MITTILLFPLMGVAILQLIDENTKTGIKYIKMITLFFTLIIFGSSIIIWIIYDNSFNEFEFIKTYSWYGIFDIRVGIDSLSLNYIILTTLLFPICILSSWNNNNYKVANYFSALLIVETLLIAVFTVVDLFIFYVFFEAALVPLFLIVGIWGGSSTRIRAAQLLFLYTLAGSLFILLSILNIAYHLNTTDFSLVTFTYFTPEHEHLIWIGFFIAFAVKTPIIPFHIWLPRAHAEAPLAGSILLAGVVLKLSSYGIIRILLCIIPNSSIFFSPFVEIIAVITIIYSGLAAIRQWDTKALVAYSSISHIGVVVIGIFSNTIIGIEGGYLLSIAHGLVSPALFIIVGGVFYDRFHTRVLQYYRGIVVYIPVASVLFFIIVCGNIAVPVTINWAGEFMALSGTFQQSPLISIIASSSIVLSACYTIWIWSRIVGGNWSSHSPYTIDITRREFIVIIPLIILTIIFGINPNIILYQIHNYAILIIY